MCRFQICISAPGAREYWVVSARNISLIGMITCRALAPILVSANSALDMLLACSWSRPHSGPWSTCFQRLLRTVHTMLCSCSMKASGNSNWSTIASVWGPMAIIGLADDLFLLCAAQPAAYNYQMKDR